MLSLNGLVITMTRPAGVVLVRANSMSGEAAQLRSAPLSSAQLRFEGVGDGGAPFEGGSGGLRWNTNANLNNNETRGSGSAYYVRANGTGATALYGWREYALGVTSACCAFGQAIEG